MIRRIISVCFLIFIGLSSILFFIGALCIWTLTILIDRRLVVLHQYSCFWASLYLWIMPAWSVKVEARERRRKGVPYVIVSNHQSNVDILVAFRLFIHFKWVSKAEVFKLPFIGWNMVLNRYVKLRRGDKDSIKEMYAHCEHHLRQGSSVYLFPEGTRSKTGQMKPFKQGAFVLAKKMKVPLLLIVINGSRDALPKHSLVITGHHRIRISIIGEIQPQEFEDLSVEELGSLAQQRIGEHLEM